MTPQRGLVLRLLGVYSAAIATSYVLWMLFSNLFMLMVRSTFASARKELFYDPGHLTPRGNDVLARAAATALEERGLVPR